VEDSADAENKSALGSIAGIAGSVLLFVGTWLHPMSADPNVPLAAFTEYAASPHWVAIHLTQLLGVVLMVTALMLLSRKLAEGPAADWATLGMTGAVSSLAVASVLQAVDGVALKVMVDRWAAALGPDKSVLFQVVFGVRQIEVGLAGITSILFGLTGFVYGVALLIDRHFPLWLGATALAAGAATASSGLAIATTGFSDIAMTISMPSSAALILWMIALGTIGWRRQAF
jgi:hypothetical protein